ncbi:tetratricopeptide repeat protein [Hydrocarboniphaga effusa]|uniref:tetratricopeptide repeat protein n=2 Tax=Hydrocarboniphaga effusa TaxID=243629 RepID=UPI003BAA7A82
MSAAAAALLATSMMWFGNDDKKKDPPPRQGTLGSLQDRRPELPPEPPVGDANQRAREGYQQYLQQPQADPKLAAEALRRIADLELEAADTAEGSPEARKAAYRKAAERYRDLLRRYPDDARNDEVLYQLARAEEGAGETKAALASLDELAQRFPQSSVIVESQFRRGEILFAQRQYREAEAAFTAIAERGPQGANQYYEPSIYKQGWARFKQDDYDASLKSFFALLDRRLGPVPEDRLDAHLKSMSRPERELIDDSLRAMALACLNIGSPKTVGEKLAAHGDPAYGYLLYESLAGIYLKQERYTDVAATLTGFVEAHPRHPQAPSFQIQAIKAFEAGGFSSQALALREDYVQRFGLDQPYWSGRQSGSQPEAVDYLRDTVWMLAQQHHALSQNAQRKPEERSADGQQAADQYRRYASYFPQDAQAPEAQFLLGDLLYERGDLPGAIKAYETAAYDYPNFGRRSDAGFAALQAYQKREAALSGAEQTAWKRQRLNADLRFATSFPQRKESAQIQSNAAAGLFEAGDLAPALAAAEAVTRNADADDASRRVAWRVIGHASFDKADYARAEAAYIQVQKLAPAGSPPDQETAERLAAAIYRQGEQAQASGQALQAAEHFSRVAAEAPETKIRVTADYDAAMATLKAGKPAQAIPMLLAFRQQHAGDPLVSEVTRTLATTYEKTGNPGAAAGELQRIAETPGADPTLQREALWHSAELLQPSDPAAAERALRQYVERYPQPFDIAIEGYQKLVDLAAKSGQEDVRADWGRRLVNFEAAGGDQRTERSRALAARASLLPAQTARDAYRQVALTLPLKSSLATKRQRLDNALNAYARAADYGVAEVATEATYETAELYHDLAKALKTSERPKDLDAEALEQYDLLLDEQIFPFEDKAIAIHEANAKRAKDGIYDLWVQKSFIELAALSPGRYAKGEQPEVSVPIAPAGTAMSARATTEFNAAVATLESGNTAAAEAAFKTLAADYKNLPGPAVMLGLVYRQMNRNADEDRVLKQAAKDFPKFAPAQHQLGIWLRRHAQFAAADEAYVKAIALDPNYAAAHHNRGVVNDLFLQKPQVALEEYERYQALLPQPDAQVGRWIADLKRRTGAPAAAKETTP